MAAHPPIGYAYRMSSAIHPLTRLAGLAAAFALGCGVFILVSRGAPAGAQLTYRLGSGDAAALALYDPQYHLQHTLVAQPSDVYYPSWSADGARLAFVQSMMPAAETDTVEHLELSQNRPQRLFPPEAMMIQIQAPPIWSPDAASVIFSAGEVAAARRRTHSLVWVGLGEDAPRVLPVDGLSTRMTAFRPLDDQTLRLVAVREGDVWLADLRRSDFVILREQVWAMGFVDAWRPVFSPDASSFVIPAVRPDAPTFDLYRFDIGREGFIKISDLRTSNETQPAWSPDGAHIAYKLLGDGPQFVILASSDGAQSRAVYRHPTARINELHWSPEGDRLVFLASLPGLHELCILELASETTSCPIIADRLDEVAWRPR